MFGCENICFSVDCTCLCVRQFWLNSYPGSFLTNQGISSYATLFYCWETLTWWFSFLVMTVVIPLFNTLSSYKDIKNIYISSALWPTVHRKEHFQGLGFRPCWLLSDCPPDGQTNRRLQATRRWHARCLEPQLSTTCTNPISTRVTTTLESATDTLI